MPNGFSKPFPCFQFLCFPQRVPLLELSSGSWVHEGNSVPRRIHVVRLSSGFAERGQNLTWVSEV